MEKYSNASAATWARTICLIVALLNFLAKLVIGNSPCHADRFRGREGQIPARLVFFVLANLNQLF